ncbi:membrane protein [Aureimonas sp. SA4125]|uniref:DUF1467 family protein n=1 Tax=Aureimonas sp. SA4125 TaxID=2826993 RepID=UPI001CC3DB33|nr:DUF1467 family protein [Aureimonas sp. SA4125]BDA84463.1 membrane protein [Aureimonas sp. SA4125]
MTWITLLALYFLIWWTVLFVVLPIGMRSQSDDDSVILGTDPSAPTHFRPLWIWSWTTFISLLVIGAYYVVTEILGIGIDSFPNLLPGVRS